MIYALVAIGGGLGSVGRFWLGGAVARLTGIGFPWGTILINIAGSLLIGCFAAMTTGMRQGEDLRAFLMAGLCGGFTTFSAFSLQTVELLRDGQIAAAAANILGSVILCSLAAAAGLALGR